MMALSIMAVFLVVILIYLLTATFYIEINSRKNLYRVRFQHVALA